MSDGIIALTDTWYFSPPAFLTYLFKFVISPCDITVNVIRTPSNMLAIDNDKIVSLRLVWNLDLAKSIAAVVLIILHPPSDPHHQQSLHP